MTKEVTFYNWLKKRNISTSSLKTYTSAENTFKREIRDITEDNIIDFLKSKPIYYRSIIKAYSQYTQIKTNWDKIYHAVKTKTWQPKAKELIFEEVRLLVKQLEFPYDMIVLLQWEFGARIREILNLKKESLTLSKLGDGEESVKVILTTKGRKSRPVFTISKSATEFLKNHLDSRGLLFPRELFVKSRIEDDDEDMKEERTIRSVYLNVWNVIKRDAKKILGKTLSTHWFRHSRITYLYENGWDVKTIQRFIGHSSLDITDKYLTSAGRDANKLATEEKNKGGLNW